LAGKESTVTIARATAAEHGVHAHHCRAALVSVDGTGRVLGWTPGAAALFGYVADEMVGTRIHRLFERVPPVGEWVDVRDRVIGHSEAVDGAATFIRRDGSLVVANVSVQPVLIGAGVVDHVHVLFEPVHAGAEPADRIDELARAHGLDDREVEVLRLLASGHRVANIARRIHLAPGTVRNLLSCLYAKLGVSSQVETIELLVGDGG
jgi:PAS domain S-box-containing protein